MKVASIQLAVVEGDKQATIDKAVAMIHEAQDADLIILPEIWNIGFMTFADYHTLAETEDGPTLTALKEAAKSIGKHVHTGSWVVEYDGKYYNSSYLLSPEGSVLANYRKIHLFGYQSQETQLLTPGTEVVTVQTELAKFGLATCYDTRFPELFRKMVDRGVEVILVCSAWPYPRLEHWVMINRVRAIENQCFMVSANSCGMNQGAMFVGHSMHTDPWGIIKGSGGDDETIVRSELDLTRVQDARDRFPALADRVDWLR